MVAMAAVLDRRNASVVASLESKAPSGGVWAVREAHRMILLAFIAGIAGALTTAALICLLVWILLIWHNRGMDVSGI